MVAEYMASAESVIHTLFTNIEYLVNFDLILFYTFITLLFGLLLTFERSRCLLMHVGYPMNIRKMFKKLLKLRYNEQYNAKSNSTTTIAFKYKVKRLGYLAASNTVMPINKYLLRPFKHLNVVHGLKRREIDECVGMMAKSDDTSFGIVKQHRIVHPHHPTHYHRKQNLFENTISYNTTSLSFSSSIKSRANKLKLILSQNRKLVKHTPKIVNSRVKLYKKLPLRSISRLWGTLNSIDLPVWMRRPCYLLYAWLFNCNLHEMDIEDLRHYRNLSEFFRRKLKPNARVIDKSNCVVSPCDGTVLHFGKVDKGYLEQVKGVNYSLKAFLGEQNWKEDKESADGQGKSENGKDALLDDCHYQNSLRQHFDTELYHCVIYLAPGDYHRFHSPTEWNINYRRHFPGELFSVNPSVARWLQGLFNLNERVVYYGEWKHGFFSMTPVGATNVGSIKVYFDPVLETNLKDHETSDVKLEKSFTLSNDSQKGVKLLRGDYFGEFNLGSTIVLIFEAPKTFDFKIQQNQKVFLGQPLGSS